MLSKFHTLLLGRGHKTQDKQSFYFLNLLPPPKKKDGAMIAVVFAVVFGVLLSFFCFSS